MDKIIIYDHSKPQETAQKLRDIARASEYAYPEQAGMCYYASMLESAYEDCCSQLMAAQNQPVEVQDLVDEACNRASKLCNDAAGRQEIADVIEWNDIAQALAGLSNRIMRINMDREAIGHQTLPF